ncbi:MAG: hypothetical protein EZS28_037853, partial [Streblomastix strix]
GKVYLVLEFCAGGDMRHYIDDMKKKGTMISNEKAWEVIAQLNSAMNQLHKNQIIHADMKPDNVLFTEDFKVKLADFGMARKLQQGRNNTTARGGFIWRPRSLELYLNNEHQMEQLITAPPPALAYASTPVYLFQGFYYYYLVGEDTFFIWISMTCSVTMSWITSTIQPITAVWHSANIAKTVHHACSMRITVVFCMSERILYAQAAFVIPAPIANYPASQLGLLTPYIIVTTIPDIDSPKDPIINRPKHVSEN